MAEYARPIPISASQASINPWALQLHSPSPGTYVVSSSSCMSHAPPVPTVKAKLNIKIYCCTPTRWRGLLPIDQSMLVGGYLPFEQQASEGYQHGVSVYVMPCLPRASNVHHILIVRSPDHSMFHPYGEIFGTKHLA